MAAFVTDHYKTCCQI